MGQDGRGLDELGDIAAVTVPLEIHAIMPPANNGTPSRPVNTDRQAG